MLLCKYTVMANRGQQMTTYIYNQHSFYFINLFIIMVMMMLFILQTYKANIKSRKSDHNFMSYTKNKNIALTWPSNSRRVLWRRFCSIWLQSVIYIKTFKYCVSSHSHKPQVFRCPHRSTFKSGKHRVIKITRFHFFFNCMKFCF